MGWTLSQVKSGQEWLIHAGGQKCSPSESNYPSYKGELYALVSAIKKLENYLALNHFKVKTDNNAFKWLISLKNGESFLVYWSQILAQFDFEV